MTTRELYTTLAKIQGPKRIGWHIWLCDGNFHLSSLNFSMIILVPSNDIGNPFVLELLSPTTSEGRGFVGWVPPRFLSFKHSNIKCIGFCPNIGGSNWIYSAKNSHGKNTPENDGVSKGTSCFQGLPVEILGVYFLLLAEKTGSTTNINYQLFREHWWRN